MADQDKLIVIFSMAIVVLFASNATALIPFNLGKTIHASIDAVGEIDTYTFSTTSSDRILIRVVSTTYGYYPMVRLNSPEGSAVKSAGQYGADDVFIEEALPGTGTYSVQVYSLIGSAKGNYSLYMSSLITPQSPKPIIFEQTAYASIDPYGEIDTYTFSTTTINRILIRIVSTTSGYYPVVRLNSPEGSAIKSAGQYGADDVFIEETLPGTGTYSVQVYSLVGSAKGNYSLYASLLASQSTPTTSTPTSTTISTPTKSGSGSILVTSFPAGASIYLDETYQGETPKKLSNLPQSSPNIRLKLEGYKDWQQNIDVTSGNTSYMPVALAPSTSTLLTSILKPEDNENLLEMVKKEISNFSKQDKENLVNIHFQDANRNLGYGKYEEAKTYLLMAKAISEDLKDRDLAEKAEMLLEVVNSKIEKKEFVKLIYELILALVAAVIFGFIFEKRMKNKRYKFLMVTVIFLVLFVIFYILGRSL